MSGSAWAGFCRICAEPQIFVVSQCSSCSLFLVSVLICVVFPPYQQAQLQSFTISKRDQCTEGITFLKSALERFNRNIKSLYKYTRSLTPLTEVQHGAVGSASSEGSDNRVQLSWFNANGYDQKTGHNYLPDSFGLGGWQQASEITHIFKINPTGLVALL